VLQISGENFFTGTSITIGDKTFAGPQDGLYLKSSQTMLLTASTDILSRALKAVVNGRYGPAVSLYSCASPEGIVIAKSKLAPVGPNFTKLELIIGDANQTKDLTIHDIEGFPDPLLSLNGSQIPYRPLLGETVDKILGEDCHHYIVATVTVPNSLLHSRDNRAGIIFPLLGGKWSAEDLIYDSDEVQITKMTGGSTTTLLISRPGIAFNNNWRIILDKSYKLNDHTELPTDSKSSRESNDKQKNKPNDKPSVVSPEFTSLTDCQDLQNPEDPNRCYLLKIVADTKFLSNYQKLILVSDTGHAQILDTPAATPQKDTPVAAPKISSITPAIVGLNEVVTVTITGSGLDAVKQVSFEGKPLTFWAVSDKEKPATSATASAQDATQSKTGQIQVLLTRDVTGKEGHQELLLQVDSKNMITTPITVAPSPTATKSTAGATKSPTSKEKTTP
jgi:hypothetical protein